MANSVDARVNPDQAAALAAQLLSEPAAETKTAVIDPPAPGTLRLPGGFVPDPQVPHAVYYDAEVKELTGADEEEIARARRTSYRKMMSTIIERGTKTLGGEPAKAEWVRGLLIGDRDALLLEISRATYSETLTFEAYPCSGCGATVDVTYGLDEVPVRRLATAGDRLFEVKLRKGRVAVVSLPTGTDQDFIFTRIVPDNSTSAEINTLLLSRCVLAVKSGESVDPVGQSTDAVRALGIADRRKILTAITERQPGPRYDEASFTHEDCGTEVLLPIGPGDLFPGL